MRLLACLGVVLGVLEGASGLCPSQCSCDALSSDDDMESRVVVLCDDPDMTEVPSSVPVETEKLRIEKAALRSIPAEAFYELLELRSLWVTYSAVASLDAGSLYNLRRLHELRLDGNGLAAFPWAALRDTPLLRTLVLHNNRIDSVPQGAAPYLRRLAYLDLSSNRLATLPPDFLDSWSHLVPAPGSQEFSPGRVILGLQDNPWRCDCHISRIIELSKAPAPALVLLDPLMMCRGPERLAGIPFQRAELERCMKPSVKISATQITSALGSNVLLRCDATGHPTPRLTWTRADGSPVNHTAIQESPTEGVRWSVISVVGISHADAGDYNCRARNLAGTADAVVAVMVVGTSTATPSAGGGLQSEAQPAWPSTSPWPLASTSSSAPSAPTSLPPPSTSPPRPSMAFSLPPAFSAVLPSSTALSPGWERKAASGLGGRTRTLVSTSGVDELVSLDGAPAVAVGAEIENLRVVDRTRDSATLAWDPRSASGASGVAVLYSRLGEEDLRPLHADTRGNRVTIVGLEAGQRYVACICPQGALPRTQQCISFTTEGSDPSHSALVLASGAAGVAVLPLIFFLLYKVCSLRCSPDPLGEDDLARETYVQFESPGELWAGHDWDEWERPLICPRSRREAPRACSSTASRPEGRC
ncbi:leucine-rich repeat, immunoglobulin-like domain and transmembrane domain-containing protein 3 [Sorex fumeus]|uniref:leucine-rich repeat, immunoglobulin-like domain and transmembrane domain-containing protein 3 n=1 Tax=Sorex fumeus TaxID=62283 RepID=UPI0024ADB8DC|nr:leucine-rich repeat, immunoglobulin-like domain and transmembrane domain-containing protein 3 [Sorex fumeus]